MTDLDRGITEMNCSLVKEVEIAGLQIWKAVEDIDHIYIRKNDYSILIDYIFTSFYQASQGIERLMKIIIELIRYNNIQNNKKPEEIRIEKLLMSHNHIAMFDFISKEINITLERRYKKLLLILYEFYSKVRYSRFRYNKNNALELELINKFGKELPEENFNDEIKTLYGRSLGEIAQLCYGAIRKLSKKLNIYAYELDSESAANLSLVAYYGENLYDTLKRVKRSKKELIWHIMGKDRDLYEYYPDIFPSLPFDEYDVSDYLEYMINNNESCYFIYDYVLSEYIDLFYDDKNKLKERMKFIDSIINSNEYYRTMSDYSDPESYYDKEIKFLERY